MKGTTSGVTTSVRWLFAPATDEVPRRQAVAAAFFRVLLGLMWLYNVAWKRPPDFGDSSHGLYKFMAYAVSHPVFPPYSWVVEHAVLPNIQVFGWIVVLAETTLAVLLLTGAWVRLAGLIGLTQCLAIGLSVAYAPHEWPWSYWLMAGSHAVILFSSAGRVFAVDAARSRLSSGRNLGLVWGAVAVIAGAVTLVGTVGDDPLDPSGYALGSSDPSISLGTYNLVGGLVLIVIGALLLVAARAQIVLLGRVAALVALAAALSLYAQIGFHDPFLGGTATSVAFLLSLAVIAVTVSGVPGRTSARD